MNQSAPTKRRGSASRAENCLPDTSKASAGFCGVTRLCTARNLTKFAAKANRELAAGRDSRATRARHIANRAKQIRLAPKALCNFSLGHRPRNSIIHERSAESAIQPRQLLYRVNAGIRAAAKTPAE